MANPLNLNESGVVEHELDRGLEVLGRGDVVVNGENE